MSTGPVTTGPVTTMAMFPLGSVHFPHMPLRLRVFEPRYLVMLDQLLRADRAEFGVVLIERGQEVGGGEHRFRYGTVAEVTSLASEDQLIGLVAEGGARFEVLDWLPDDPYPRAEVRMLPELEWQEDRRGSLNETETVVRRTLAQASEFRQGVWPADVELSDDPLSAAWQLAAVAPLGSLDHLDLLRSDSCATLLQRTAELCASAASEFQAPWPADFDS